MSPKDSSAQFHKIRELLSVPDFFSSLDFHFGLFIGRMAKNYALETALAGALVSRSTGAGNVCLDLKEYAGNPLPLISGFRPDEKPSFICPNLAVWTGQLLESGVVSHDENMSPLVLAGDSRLYLRRYWEYEKCIIRFFRQHTDSEQIVVDDDRLQLDMKKLFNELPDQEPDWQQVAAIAALHRPFCIISGGPGTGKTTTIAKILALLTNQFIGRSAPRILLAAPTGKAASRLQQAIAETGLFNPGPENLKAATVHRLLGHIPNSPYFRHNMENPLEADIIVIDEASMVDLPLMAKLMQAVPPKARLILLGDRYQLASVQPGSVLGDICSTKIISNFSSDFTKRVTKLTGISIKKHPEQEESGKFSPLLDSFVELEHSYRFKPDSPIARLSRAVKNGDGDNALDILLTSNNDDIAWKDIPDPADLGIALGDSPLVKHLREMQQAPDPSTCFSLLDNFRLLCGLRQGPFGVDRINLLLEQSFSQQKPAVYAGQHPNRLSNQRFALVVRPVMVTQNDYNLQLYNGDVGIIMSEPHKPLSVRAHFRNEQGNMRDIAVPLLPGHETVFAMTVHKSQGSEFNNLLLILPDRDSPVLTRELLYTAITRAREKVEIWGSKEIFTAAVKRRLKRTSGLSEVLLDSNP